MVLDNAAQVSDATAPMGYIGGMNAYLIVFLGAGIGGSLRHGVNLTCARYCGLEFPWGTMIVNILGSTIMGIVVGYFAFKAGEGWTQHARLFLTTGILGGFTTFSAFSLDAVLLWQRGETGMAAFYVFGSVILALLGLFAGLALMRTLS
jgi:CrcB protein